MKGAATCRVSVAAACGFVGLMSTACLQPSLYPLLVGEDSIFDERLLGAWTCGDDETWTFREKTERSPNGRANRFFGLRVTGGPGSADLDAVVGRLGSADFVSFGIDDIADDPAPLFALRHLIGAYTFGRIKVEKDRVVLDMLDSSWMNKATDKATRSLGVKRSDDQFVLTAPTKSLQAFARAHARDEAAFSDRVVLVRPGETGGTCYSEK